MFYKPQLGLNNLLLVGNVAIVAVQAGLDSITHSCWLLVKVRCKIFGDFAVASKSSLMLQRFLLVPSR